MRFGILSVVVVAFLIFYWPVSVDLDGLKGMKILITGGGSGIGEEMAKLAYAHGAIVTIVGRRQSRLDKVCAQAAQQGGDGKCFGVQGDMAIKANVQYAVNKAAELMGSVDALILNHVWGVMKFFEDVPFDGIEEAFDLTYKPNVLGNMWLINQCLPFLKANNVSSHILYVSSLSITYGVPKATFYASSKLAMHGVIDTLRMELGPKSTVHLTTVNVGAVATDVFKEAMLNPKEEADAAMTPEKCAGILLDSMLAKKRLVTMPLVDRPFPIPGHFSTYFPELMEWLVRTQYSITDEKQGFLKDMGGQPPTN